MKYKLFLTQDVGKEKKAKYFFFLKKSKFFFLWLSINTLVVFKFFFYNPKTY